MKDTMNKPSKEHSRLMIGLCLAVLTAVGAASGIFAQEEAAKEKESAAAVIEQVLNEKGIDAAKAKFFLLRTKKEDYSFIEDEFTALGNKLLQAGRPQDAVAVLEMGVRLYPDSINMYWPLANAHYRAGNSEKSIEVISKMKSIQ